MSHVEFKKWSCCISLSSSCPMSPLKCCHVEFKKCHVLCHYFFWPCQYALCRMLILRNCRVAVSNLGVKSHCYNLTDGFDCSAVNCLDSIG